MIKKMLVVLAAAIPMLAQAEVSAGTIEVTGASKLGFQSTTFKPDGGEKSTTNTFGADLGVLYYVTPMIGVGAEVSYDNSTDKSPGNPDVKFTSWTLAPKVGLDVPLAEKTAFFADLKIGWTSADSDGFKTDGFGWGVGAGIKYFIAPSFSANLGLNYDSVSLKADGGAKATGTNLFVGVGFSGYFGGSGAHH
jgi:opacity protein-like surface antigen